MTKKRFVARRGVLGLAVAAAAAIGLALMPTPAAARGDIVETAQSAGQFRTLLAAATAAGLAPTLKGRGPFTVFAPTDRAFAALPGGTVENLLKPQNRGQLRAILAYHVVPGRVFAADVDGKRVHARTVNGAQVSVDGKGAGVRVNRARVVTADVRASNGVIHVIDRVLIPPAH
jgi:uncharacterized surface protein with fasciclin (FAS1) repeats